jgi:hypothetical protein
MKLVLVKTSSENPEYFSLIKKSKQNKAYRNFQEKYEKKLKNISKKEGFLK